MHVQIPTLVSTGPLRVGQHQSGAKLYNDEQIQAGVGAGTSLKAPD